jgi:hypothetical protein
MQRLGEGLLKPLGIVLLKLMVFQNGRHQNGHQEHFQHREILLILFIIVVFVFEIKWFKY